jgi:multiple sugar transport system permease protein
VLIAEPLVKNTDEKVLRLFVLPAAALFGILLVPPALYIIHLSFFTWGGSAVTPPRFVGLRNILAMLGDERFWLGLLRTFYYSASAVFLSVLTGFIFALILRRKVMGSRLFRSLVLLPMVSTPVAVAVTWVIMYNPLSGLFNWLLSIVGLPPQPWLSAGATVIPSSESSRSSSSASC